MPFLNAENASWAKPKLLLITKVSTLNYIAFLIVIFLFLVEIACAKKLNGVCKYTLRFLDQGVEKYCLLYTESVGYYG